MCNHAGEFLFIVIAIGVIYAIYNRKKSNQDTEPAPDDAPAKKSSSFFGDDSSLRSGLARDVMWLGIVIFGAWVILGMLGATSKSCGRSCRDAKEWQAKRDHARRMKHQALIRAEKKQALKKARRKQVLRAKRHSRHRRKRFRRRTRTHPAPPLPPPLWVQMPHEIGSLEEYPGP